MQPETKVPHLPFSSTAPVVLAEDGYPTAFVWNGTSSGASVSHITIVDGGGGTMELFWNRTVIGIGAGLDAKKPCLPLSVYQRPLRHKASK